MNDHIFLKSPEELDKWISDELLDPNTDKIETPTEYPCFASLRTESFGYEASRICYLYRSDIQQMLNMIDSHKEVINE